jgi:amino-acid N-acetyltransferase
MNLTNRTGFVEKQGEHDNPYTVRKATMRDIPAMLALINGFAANGIMLPRTEFEMAENIRDFMVAEYDGAVVGAGALHLYTADSAEIRSLAVSPAHQKAGVGAKLVAALEREAREFGLAAVFAFTYVDRFFAKLGYREVERGELPLKAWKDCLRCPKFQCCDEIAMLKPLREGYVPDVSLPRGAGLVQLPGRA